jgi:hypothetical protein
MVPVPAAPNHCPGVALGQIVITHKARRVGIFGTGGGVASMQFEGATKVMATESHTARLPCSP